MTMDSITIIRDHLIFRILLKAMSRPGRVYPLPDCPPGLPAAACLLNCLLDNETCLAVIGDSELDTFLPRHFGCLSVAPEEADFVLVGRGAESVCQDLALRCGSLEFPDRGATVVYLVDQLTEGSGTLSLTGPGIDGGISLGIGGLAADDLRYLQRLNSTYPLGVDAIFLDRQGYVACIPRSSRMRVN